MGIWVIEIYIANATDREDMTFNRVLYFLSHPLTLVLDTTALCKPFLCGVLRVCAGNELLMMQDSSRIKS